VKTKTKGEVEVVWLWNGTGTKTARCPRTDESARHARPWVRSRLSRACSRFRSRPRPRE
jgi:hypothetical protein